MVVLQNLRCLLIVLLLIGAPSSLWAQSEEDGTGPDFAEQVPLAASSLMLDVVQSGDRLVAVGERGHVIFSDDQGQTWRQAESVPTRSTLTSVYARDDLLWAGGHDSVLLASADNGNNWSLQYFDPERQQPVMDLYFADADNGIAVGAYGLMLVTSDGGENWDDWAVNDEDEMHLNAITETADGGLMIAGEAGFSYRSEDVGETWESLELPYRGSMFGAVAYDSSCVMFFGLRGHAMSSCDDGLTWEEMDTGTQATLLGGTSSGDGVVIVGNSGLVLEYNPDSGFSASTHSSGVDFSSVVAVGPGQFLLVGEDGTHFYPESTGEGVQR